MPGVKGSQPSAWTRKYQAFKIIELGQVLRLNRRTGWAFGGLPVSPPVAVSWQKGCRALPSRWAALLLQAAARLHPAQVDADSLGRRISPAVAHGPIRVFRGAVMGDGVMTPFVPNTESQDTLTIGTTAWL